MDNQLLSATSDMVTAFTKAELSESITISNLDSTSYQVQFSLSDAKLKQSEYYPI